jgi:hypothetical protein
MVPLQKHIAGPLYVAGYQSKGLAMIFKAPTWKQGLG